MKSGIWAIAKGWGVEGGLSKKFRQLMTAIASSGEWPTDKDSSTKTLSSVIDKSASSELKNPLSSSGMKWIAWSLADSFGSDGYHSLSNDLIKIGSEVEKNLDVEEIAIQEVLNKI